MSELHQDHDLDLIAALAEGRLDDPAPAKALVDACPDCALAYRSHHTVLEAVRLQTPATLDDLERRRLRAAVWDGIESGAEPSAPTATPQRKPSTIPWWYRVAPVAAALVVVVGVAANIVPGVDSTGGEDLMTTAPVDAFESPEAATESAADTLAAADGPDATDSGTATTSAESGGATQMVSDAMERAATQFGERADVDVDSVAAEADECVTADPDADAPAVAAEAAVIDGVDTWLVALGTPTEVTRVMVYAADDCRVLYRGD